MNHSEGRLPTFNDVHFDAAQLESTVVELKFPPVARFSDETFLADIKDALSVEYPLVEPTNILNLVLSPQGISQSVAGSAFRFRSLDGRWVLMLTDTSVSLETRTYSDIDEFAKRFTDVLSQVAQHLKLRHQLRLGLRYVNEFRSPDWTTYADFRRILNPELLGWAARDLLEGTVEQTLGEVRTRRNDGIVLVRHGFLQGTTVLPIAPAAPKTGPFYLLDLDYFDETPQTFSVEAPSEHMRMYNAVLYRLFRWVINDGELFKHLGGH